MKHPISGTVFVDLNGNGIRNIYGVNGYVGITETTYAGQPSVTVTANPGGRKNTAGTNYTIPNNPNGTYTVTLSAVAGYTISSTNPRTVTVNGVAVTGVDFGIKPIPCQVTTSPSALNLTMGGATGAITATVTTGLGTSSITSMAFGVYDTTIATANPTSDASTPYSTTITQKASGNTAAWATATLADGRTCPTSGNTDTDVHVGYTISGNVFVDTNTPYGAKNGTDKNAPAGVVVNCKTGNTTISTQTIGAAGIYTCGGLLAGTYSVTLIPPIGTIATTANPVTPVTVGAGLNATANFGYAPVTITGQVYLDNNGNGIDNADSIYTLSPIQVILKQNNVTVATTYITTDGGPASAITGKYTFTNALPQTTYTVSIVAPSYYNITAPIGPASVFTSSIINTQNFGIQWPAPTCTGAVTANPTQIYAGGNPAPATSTLSIAGCTPGNGGLGTVTYAWAAVAKGTISPVNTASTTYTPPLAYSTYTKVNLSPSVSVCNPGVGASCKLYSGNLTLIPVFKASGEVYIDIDKNGQLDPGELPYTDAPLTVTICAGNIGTICAAPSSPPYETIQTNAGTFTTVGVKPLIPGKYTAFLTIRRPYQATTTLSYPFTVGNASTAPNVCATSLPPAPADCTPDGSGNVENLNFGITDSFAWIQAIGGDITGNNISNPNGGGFQDNIPAPAGINGGACSANGANILALGAGGTSGLINIGSKSLDKGQGQISARNWVVGGISANYPYIYSTPLSNGARTSYSNLSYLIQQSNIKEDPLPGCSNNPNGSSDCTLPANLTSGVYTINGDINLNSDTGTYIFPSGKYTILVNGKININTKIKVLNGSFVLFSASDDINVAPTIGENYSSTTSDLEGYYSTDKSFTLLGKGDPYGTVVDCSTGATDLRLNAAGSIVVNAVTSNNGGFYYQNRDICAYDTQCPVFTITERPDFILNSPTYLMFPRRTWQEVAP
jgi:hypothetical protein